MPSDASEAAAFARLKHFFNRCKPDEPVPASDEHHYYVDFDALQLRGERCVDTLASTIALDDGATCQLFTGFSGSGKSSELLRLRALLERRQYLVVYIDALDVLELQKPIEYPEVLTHIGLAVDAAMTTLVKAGKATAWARSFGQEIRSLLGSDVKVSKVEANTSGAGLGVELRHNDVFRQSLRETAKSHRHQFLAQAGDFFADAERLLLRHGYAGLVVIFDSLEKIGDLPELQEPARRMFLGEHEALRLPAVNMLYTVPVRLVFSGAGPVLGQLYDGEPQVLPMVKVRDRASGAPVAQGHQALRQLLARRVDFDEVFGGDEALVARLVDNSGGYIRDLLRLTQYSLQGAGSLPVREEHVSQAIAKLRRSYVRAYSTDFDDLLRYIHEHRPEVVPASLSTHLEDVVVTHLTMVYGNEKDWYDVHPLIRDLVQR
jgi:hypothetical protein